MARQAYGKLQQPLQGTPWASWTLVECGFRPGSWAQSPPVATGPLHPQIPGPNSQSASQALHPGGSSAHMSLYLSDPMQE
jgi:hypothetical protein